VGDGRAGCRCVWPKTAEDVAGLGRNAFASSFLDEDRRGALLDELDAVLAKHARRD
jgi:adenosine deaminase